MRMIKQVRRSLAIWAAKLIGTVCRLAGKQGVTWAGQVAIIICPDILRELSEQVRGSIFVSVEPTEKLRPTTFSVKP